jgi:nitrile hydratase accessory protein
MTISSERSLPRESHGPVFAEPWQAQAFALAVRLSADGHFTWKEWAATLADELQAASDRGEPDDGSRYYEYWLAALERLVTAKGLADTSALATRKQDWAAAYQNTPHGQPVELVRSRAPEALWLVLGAGCTLAVYWMLQQASVEPPGEHGLWANWSAFEAGSGIAPVGFSASAVLGTMLGMRHALEPDHLAAVSTLMTGERSSAKAAWLGACWGLGHTLTLLTTGVLLVMFRAEMPAIAAQVFELCVVMLLVGFGVRAMDRRTLARPLLVGAVHGLAGSGALTALVVTTLPSTATRLAYLTLFGVGSIVGMAALSGLLGWPLARGGAHRLFARTVSLAVGCVSTALGLFWGYPLIEGLFY